MKEVNIVENELCDEEIEELAIQYYAYGEFKGRKRKCTTEK